MSKINTIKDLVKQLNEASDAYYNTGYTIMSDRDFDMNFDALKALEEETGFIMASSPTQNVGYEVKSKLEKVEHNHPMLSLDKTKDIGEVANFIGDKACIIMGKMDGLTCTLKYVGGELVSAETRGNGYVGEDILHCAKVVKNIPLRINHTDELIIDGEIIITYDDFDKINENLPDDQKYRNPRNLASGSVRQLDSSVAAQRSMKFIAWKVVKGIENNSFFERLCEASRLGFEITPCVSEPHVTAKTVDLTIGWVKKMCDDASFPIDGCVIGYDDVAYGESLGATSHHLRSQLAFKFEDEVYETKLLDIEWTVGRSSVIVPTAVFEPVEIDGTMVEKASVHNVSVLTQLDLHVGDIIEVYKANQIIPQVHRNISAENRIDTDYIRIPGVCPVCDGDTEIKDTENSKILICTNPDCAAKKLAQFTHFVSRNCMNIDGLSEKILEKLITSGMLYHCDDIYRLKEYKPRLMMMDGFGKKSVEKLLDAIEQSKNIKLENFIAALGIPNIGLSAAKTISKYFNGDYDKFIECVEYFDWTVLDDFGETMNASIKSYFANNYDMVTKLASYMNFKLNDVSESSDCLNGKVFVVTGSLNHFDNRDALKGKIEALGGKVVGSISKKTDYLINNDVESTSSKNKKAKELNIPIITEEQFIEMIGE